MHHYTERPSRKIYSDIYLKFYLEDGRLDEIIPFLAFNQKIS